MDKLEFMQACDKVINIEKVRSGIGTLSEKTLHAVLKLYFEPDEGKHEIKVGSLVADIVNDTGIIEIQTRSFDKLRKKLEAFLLVSSVTVVYPIANAKWLLWIDKNTGEITKKRKSPKKGTPYEALYELYKIKALLPKDNLKLCIVMLDIEEYRYLNGWSEDGKKGSSRCDRIPIDIAAEIHIESIADYMKFIPEELPMQFTTKDYKKATGLSLSNAQTALNVLNYVSAVNRVGKKGNMYLYEKKL